MQNWVASAKFHCTFVWCEICPRAWVASATFLLPTVYWTVRYTVSHLSIFCSVCSFFEQISYTIISKIRFVSKMDIKSNTHCFIMMNKSKYVNSHRTNLKWNFARATEFCTCDPSSTTVIAYTYTNVRLVYEIVHYSDHFCALYRMNLLWDFARATEFCICVRDSKLHSSLIIYMFDEIVFPIYLKNNSFISFLWKANISMSVRHISTHSTH